eukprot:jgi/Mesvir1/18981/Mv18944-RA.1
MTAKLASLSVSSLSAVEGPIQQLIGRLERSTTEPLTDDEWAGIAAFCGEIVRLLKAKGGAISNSSPIAGAAIAEVDASFRQLYKVARSKDSEVVLGLLRKAAGALGGALVSARELQGGLIPLEL